MNKSTRKYLNIVLLALWAAIVTTACARGGMISNGAPTLLGENTNMDPTGTSPDDINPNTGHNNGENQGGGKTDVTPDPDDVDVTPVDPNLPPVPPPVDPGDSKIDTSDFLPLSWDKKSGAKEWSKMIYTVIENEEPQMLNKKSADDIQFFCPTYYSLARGQRLNFWGEFFVALALPESSWDPTSQMTEKTMDMDPVTRRQVRSEGLLQLSYQDEKSYGLDCGFNYEKDKVLDTKDPRRTILDPYLNLRCGIKIMAIQLRKHKSITMKTNVYWSVLRLGGKYSKINQIARTTKALKICQK